MATDVKEKYVLRIMRDEEANSPRDNDNLGEMICFHKRYNLGDQHDFADKDEFLFELLSEALGSDELAELKYEEVAKNIDTKYNKNGSSYERELDNKIIEIIQENNVIMPLYLYEHSGITMNTIGFSDKWDSGNVGWLYVSNDDIKKVYGEISSSTLDIVKTALLAEVKEYDNYIQGNCYGFKLYKDGEEINSSYGFIGTLEEAKKAIQEYLPAEAQHLVEKAEANDIEKEENPTETKDNNNKNIENIDKSKTSENDIEDEDEYEN